MIKFGNCTIIVNVKQKQQESIIHDITFGLRLALQDRFLSSLGKSSLTLFRTFCNSLDMLQINLTLFLYIPILKIESYSIVSSYKDDISVTNITQLL